VKICLGCVFKTYRGYRKKKGLIMYQVIQVIDNKKRILLSNLSLHQAIAECMGNSNLHYVKKGSKKWKF